MILFHLYEETGERTERGALIYRHCVVVARSREQAKLRCRSYLKGDLDRVIIEPLSKPGEVVHLFS